VSLLERLDYLSEIKRGKEENKELLKRCFCSGDIVVLWLLLECVPYSPIAHNNIQRGVSIISLNSQLYTK